MVDVTTRVNPLSATPVSRDVQCAWISGRVMFDHRTMTKEDTIMASRAMLALGILFLGVLPAVAISVDGNLGDWASLYRHSDPADDKAGDIEMIEWGATYSDGVLYSFQKVVPGPDSKTLLDQGANGPWADLWLDVDNSASTQVGNVTGPQALDDELGWAGADISFQFSTGGAQPAAPYVQLYGRGNDWWSGGPLPASAQAAFSSDGLTIEFSCPLADILNELPSTDGATAGPIFRVGPRIDGIFPGGGSWGADVSASTLLTVPEPGTLFGFLAAVCGLMAYAWRRRK